MICVRLITADVFKGVSRSATVVIGYIMEELQIPYSAAYEIVKKSRLKSRIKNIEFKFVINFVVLQTCY